MYTILHKIMIGTSVEDGISRKHKFAFKFVTVMILCYQATHVRSVLHVLWWKCRRALPYRPILWLFIFRAITRRSKKIQMGKRKQVNIQNRMSTCTRLSCKRTGNTLHWMYATAVVIITFPTDVCVCVICQSLIFSGPYITRTKCISMSWIWTRSIR